MSSEDHTRDEDAPEALGTPHSEEADVEVEREQDAPTVAELDPETRARRDAALRQVRKLGDPVLRATALPVDRFDAALRAEVERMGGLMHDALGVGLAATQLGVLHRVLVYRAYAEDPVTALVNPELTWMSDELEAGEEGCLSLPGVHVEVERAARVRVRARDEQGEEREVEAEGLEARVIQHEIDHLNGVLILDRISRQARKEAMRAMREAQALGDAGKRRVAAAAGDGIREHGLPRHIRVRGGRCSSGSRAARLIDQRSSSPGRTGRGARATPDAPPVAERARALGIALEQPESVNDPEARALIASRSRRRQASPARRSWFAPSGRSSRSRCSPNTRCSTFIRRCFRAGGAPRRSSGR